VADQTNGRPTDPASDPNTNTGAGTTQAPAGIDNTRPINDSPGTPPNSNSTLDNAKQSAPTSDGQDIGVNYLPAPNFLDANSEPQGEAPPVDPNFLDANSEPQGEPPLAIDPTSVTIPSNQQIERDF